MYLSYPVVLVLGVKGPIPLWHFGKQEILAKIDLMEDIYDITLTFDEGLIPAQATPMAAGEGFGA